MADDDRWLVVGLGNPEGEYGGTRHNVGADLVRLVAAREGAVLSRNRRVRCELAETRLGGAKVALAVPMSYMNTSGDPVAAAVRWCKVETARLVVCHDDLDLPVGSLKVKRGGGNAGHNGLKDIDRALSTREYLRIRIGIGRPPGRMPSRDHVLRRFPPREREAIDGVLELAADAVASLVADGLEQTQNRFHASG